MLLSVPCATPGRLSIGPPLMVGCIILPEPVRTAITKSDSSPSSTGRSRPHSIRAFSTFWRAVAFAIGLSTGSPAPGLTTTRTVLALNTYSGRDDFFLSFAFAGTANRAAKRISAKRRAVMGASVTSEYAAIILKLKCAAPASSRTRLASNVLGFKGTVGRVAPLKEFEFDQHSIRQGFWDEERARHQGADAEGSGHQRPGAGDPEAH